MRAVVRGFAWFLGSLIVAAVVLRATVFDVWTVTDVSRGLAEPSRVVPRIPEPKTVSPNTLTPGDVVLVLRDSKPSAGDIARCTGPDGTGAFALRVAPAPVGSSDPNDLPKPARMASPRTVNPPKRARAGARSSRETPERLQATPPETPAAAPTSLPAPPKSGESTTCRRVVFRLWGEKGPQDPDHRFTLVD